MLSRTIGCSRPRPTSEVIAALVADLNPVSRRAVACRLAVPAGAGSALSLLLVGASLGYRPDMAEAVGTAMFWVKLAYTLALGLLATRALERLSRPAIPAAGRAAAMLLPVLAVAALGASQLALAEPADRMAMMLGDSAAVCPWRILAFAAPPFAALVWAVRGLAPTRLRLAGAALGVAAGGFGAAAYALGCPESAPAFLAVWYTLAIVIAAAIGGLAGPWALRW